MEMFNTIRIILGFVILIGLAVNFFYQVFKAFKKLNQTNYAKETLHRFKCRNCEEAYQLDGEEAKALISFWTPRVETQTINNQNTALRFECPICHEKTLQDRIFDTDITALKGNVRAQFDDSAKSIIVDLLVKAFLPVFIGMFLLSIIFP